MSDPLEKEDALRDVAEESLPAQNESVESSNEPKPETEPVEIMETSVDDSNSTKKTLDASEASIKDEDIKDDDAVGFVLDGSKRDESVEVGNSEAPKQALKRRMSVITISDSDSSSSSICHVESYQASTSEVKRIRGDLDYSSSSSSNGSSDSESDGEDDDTIPCTILHYEASEFSKCNVELKPRAPRTADIKVNDCFVSADLDQKLLTHWKKSESFQCTNLVFHAEPFRLCIMDNFLKEPEFINNIIDDMNTLDWIRKRMDLYVLHRSNDLEELTWQRGVKGFYDLLRNDIRDWVARMTNLKLTHTSASCALYGPADHLLVHDDLMTDRKVAFIFYLAPWDLQKNTTEKTDSKTAESLIDTDMETREDVGWNRSMGGSLDLYGSDDRGLPTVPMRSLLPRNNTFVFFKVTPTSFHQVGEVLSYDFPRLTINGWFHGPPEDEEPSGDEDDTIIAYKDIGEKPHGELFQTTLNDWISPTYLSPRTKFKIQQHIESDSEISLEDFLLPHHYDKILEFLQNKDLPWTTKTPCNLYDYQILPADAEAVVGSPMAELRQLLSSSHFLRLLTEYTELKLKTYLRLEVQRWTSASYSVLPHKEEYDINELDIVLYAGLPKRTISGGTTIYLVPEEEDSENALINVELKNNALNLIYSDEGTSKFTKYISKLSMKEGEYFYIVVCTFRE